MIYSLLVAQAKVQSFPNRTDGARSHTTWKWKYMLMKMVMPGERIAEEESEDTDGTDTASIGDIGESSDILSSDILSSDIHHHHLPILALMKKWTHKETAFLSRRVLCR